MFPGSCDSQAITAVFLPFIPLSSSWAKVVARGWFVAFQTVEVAEPCDLFYDILVLFKGLRLTIQAMARTDGKDRDDGCRRMPGLNKIVLPGLFRRLKAPANGGDVPHGSGMERFRLSSGPRIGIQQGTFVEYC